MPPGFQKGPGPGAGGEGRGAGLLHEPFVHHGPTAPQRDRGGRSGVIDWNDDEHTTTQEDESRPLEVHRLPRISIVLPGTTHPLLPVVVSELWLVDIQGLNHEQGPGRGGGRPTPPPSPRRWFACSSN